MGIPPLWGTVTAENARLGVRRPEPICNSMQTSSALLTRLRIPAKELCSWRWLLPSKECEMPCQHQTSPGKSGNLAAWFRRPVYWQILGCSPGTAMCVHVPGSGWHLLLWLWGDLDALQAASTALVYQFSESKMKVISNLETWGLFHLLPEIQSHGSAMPGECAGYSSLVWQDCALEALVLKLCCSVTNWGLPGPTEQHKGEP